MTQTLGVRKAPSRLFADTLVKNEIFAYPFKCKPFRSFNFKLSSDYTKMRKRTVFRRRMFIFAAILFMVFLLLAFIRGRILVTRWYRIPYASDLQKHPAEGNISDLCCKKRLTLVALSDLHGDISGRNFKRMSLLIKDIAPDLIVYLGDMIEKTQPEESMEVLEKLTEQLSAIAPVYYVDGNHEQELHETSPDLYMQLNSSLDDMGAVHLNNTVIQIKDGIQSNPVNLCGISSHYYWGDSENDLLKKLSNMEGIKILLCHYPESVLWYDAFELGNLDAALCGHTHGGLIRIPLMGGIYAPEQGWIPLYDLGQYPVYTDTNFRHKGGSDFSDYLGTMVISGGLAGEHGIPRINNPMEISVIELSNGYE